MMAEYIEREAALKAIDDIEGECTHYFYGVAITSVTSEILALPAADVVEVVRCKDCKNWENNHLCREWSVYGTIETKAEQYCSSGKRKDGSDGPA